MKIENSNIKNWSGDLKFTTINADVSKTAIFSQEELIEKIIEKFSAKPIIQHKCHNCGAPLILKEDQFIFICEYCSAVYLIGTDRINDKGN